MSDAPTPGLHRRRAAVLALLLALGFAAVGGQLVRLGVQGGSLVRNEQVEPLGRSAARPDIVDRSGRLLATDVAIPSLYVDPSRVLDRDELIEKLAAALPGLDERQLAAALADPGRRFAWIRRGLSPEQARDIHDLGLPGLAFRTELRRVYPAGEDAGHIIGAVDGENHGTSGIERYLDAQGLVDMADGATRSTRPPIALSIDLSVQHAVRSELEQAQASYGAVAAAGLVLDATTGEVIASVSLPDFPAGNAALSLEPDRLDRIAGGTYELGSVLKTMTLAMAYEAGLIDDKRLYDVTHPLRVGASSIDDFHPAHQAMTAREVFLHSSNIGAAMIADQAGEQRLRAFLERLGLTRQITTELGSVPAPQLPAHWGRLSTMTVAFGHGIALSPLHFVASAAALVNGGRVLSPTYLRAEAGERAAGKAIVSAPTVAFMRSLMSDVVTAEGGTGGRAAVRGYDVGGKTGTADIPGKGGYGHNGVLSSFLAAFPVHAPRYVTYVLLWAPRGTEADGGTTAAGATAAPLTARIIARIAPLLGLAPVYGGGRT